MTKFHITEDGPKSCLAQPGNCPITKNNGEPHYESKEEAQAVYESHMSSKNLSIMKSIKYAPKKPNIEPVSVDEIQSIFSRFDNEKGLTKPSIMKGNIVGYSIAGSSLYNLHHPDSDRDIVVIMDTTSKKDYQKVFDDGTDIRITTAFNFAKSILINSPNNVDLLKSQEFQLDNTHSLYPYLKSIKFNKFAYIDNVEGHAFSNTRDSLQDSGNIKRANKSLKTSFRNFCMSDKVYRDGQNFQPCFNDLQREQFYKSLHSIEKEANKIRPVCEPYYTIMHNKHIENRKSPEILENDKEYNNALSIVQKYENNIIDLYMTERIKLR